MSLREEALIKRRAPVVAPIQPVSVIEMIFIEQEVAVARGEISYEASILNLCQLALNEIYTLAINDPNVWKEFQKHILKSLEVRYGDKLPPIEFKTRNIRGELSGILEKHIAKLENIYDLKGGISALRGLVELRTCEIIVTASKSFFRYYGLMKWIR